MVKKSFCLALLLSIAAFGFAADISITNITDNEVVSYELLMIKGSTTNYIDQVAVNVDSVTTYWNVNALNEFKAFVHLSQGENLIRMSAPGHTTKEITVSYEPKSDGYRVRFHYLIASDGDGSFKAPSGMTNDLTSGKKRYTMLALLTQSMYAELMYNLGYGRKTFQIYKPESNPDDFVNVVYTNRTTADWHNYNLQTFVENTAPYTSTALYYSLATYIDHDYTYIKNIIITAFSEKDETVFYYNSKDGKEYAMTYGATALGGGDLAVIDALGLYSFPEDITGLNSAIMDDSTVPWSINQRYDLPKPNYEVLGTALGGNMHELGHAFTLDHVLGDIAIDRATGTQSEDQRGIMSLGFYQNGYQMFQSEKPDGTVIAADESAIWTYGYTEGNAGSIIQDSAQQMADLPWFTYTDSKTIESEDPANILTNYAEIHSSSYSSGGYTVGNVGTIEYPAVYMDEAGTYELSVFYSEPDERGIEIIVNNGTPIQIMCPYPGAWNVVSSLDVEVDLNAGLNSIIIQKYQTPYGPDIDKIEIQLEDDDFLFIEGETGQLSGGAYVSSTDYGYTGTGYVDGFTTPGAAVAFTVDVPMAGDYPVALKYNNTNASFMSMSIYVNGIKIKQNIFPSITGTDRYAPNVQVLSLNQGTNTITYQVDAADTGNIRIDSMKIHFPEIEISLTEPALWDNQDIGNVGATGSASEANGTFTIEGSGADIWNTADEFHYVYQSFSGNGEIIARVVNVQNTNSWAKAGVMIRESLADNSKHAFMALTPGNGVSFQRRTSTGGTSSQTSSPASAPMYVKLVRESNFFTGYASPNGTNWTQIGSAAITMAADVYIGLAVTSHADGVICQSTIDSVSIGVPVQQPYGGTPASLSVGAVIQGEDYDTGGQGTAYNDGTSGNAGGAYRSDNVDIETCGEGGYNVGWMDEGEWLEYTVNVTPGTYTIVARVASNTSTNGDLRILLDGVELGIIPVGNTGGWQSYADASLSNITLAGGNNKVLRLEVVNGGSINVNYLRFE